MKKLTWVKVVLSVLAILVALASFRPNNNVAASLTGSWLWQQGSQQQTVCLVDNYLAFVSFDVQNKKFDYTWGGPYQVKGKDLVVQVQFNNKEKDQVGTTLTFPIEWKGDKLVASFGGKQAEWKQTDNGVAPLAGVWRISGRKQGEQINEMQLGARRTLKILTGSRFQWAAINIETKEFSGTGGGRYTFENGKYTEHIEFFSRDSSRVGASLSFDGKIENGAWHHSGLSSRGEPIYEIWSRLK